MVKDNKNSIDSPKLPPIPKTVLLNLKKHLRESDKMLEKAKELLKSDDCCERLELLTREIDKEFFIIKRTLMFNLKPKRSVHEFNKWYDFISNNVNTEEKLKKRPRYVVPRSPILNIRIATADRATKRSSIITNEKCLDMKSTMTLIKKIDIFSKTKKFKRDIRDMVCPLDDLLISDIDENNLSLNRLYPQ